MSETVTVEVGDTEVEVSETEDGFEVTEAEDEPEGLYLRVTSNDGYGAEIPLDAPYALGYEEGSTLGGNPHYFAWRQEDNIDDELMQDGGASRFADDEGEERDVDFDGHAVVEDFEIVRH